ncbi:MAG TPA: hypothetical protein VGK52_14580 [Polyangia bacterium]
MSGYAFDLVLLVADLDQEVALRTLVDHRAPSLGIRELNWTLLRDYRHDPGCLNESPNVLQPFQSRAAHALVVLDREGSGREDLAAIEIEEIVAARLAESGWGDRARVIVVDPELESWVWSASPKVGEVLGWQGRNPPLRDWLRLQGFIGTVDEKPSRPKEAMRAALKEVRQPVSASIFGRLAREVGLERCADASFARLKDVLRGWFGDQVDQVE